ncbi:hypothetical protein OQA88_13186 [Cercophora sp. LCS_1]
MVTSTTNSTTRAPCYRGSPSPADHHSQQFGTFNQHFQFGDCGKYDRIGVALYLHLTAWNAGEYEVLAGFFESSYDPAICDADFPFAPHISTLSLTASPHAADPLLSEEMPQCLMGSGAIKHLEVFGACLVINQDAPVGCEFLPARWSSLETIRLLGAYMTGEWWYRLCKDARPRLRSVEISLSPRYDEGEGDVDKPGYNEAFLSCADSLQHLRIGPGLVTTGLPCLTSMARLTYLEASVTAIFPSPAAMRTADICDHLPPSLQSVTLVDNLVDPWPSSDPPVKDEEYASLLKMALSKLLLGSERTLPRLKRVSIQVRSTSWGDYHEKTPEVRNLCTVSSQSANTIRIDGITIQGNTLM